MPAAGDGQSFADSGKVVTVTYEIDCVKARSTGGSTFQVPATQMKPTPNTWMALLPDTFRVGDDEALVYCRGTARTGDGDVRRTVTVFVSASAIGPPVQSHGPLTSAVPAPANDFLQDGEVIADVRDVARNSTYTISDRPGTQEAVAVTLVQIRGSRSQAKVRDKVTVVLAKFDVDIRDAGSGYFDFMDMSVGPPIPPALAVDGVYSFLPGCEKDSAGASTYSPVLSSGSTYRAPGYVGQELRAAILGLGADAGVTRVAFRIRDSVTNLPGFCGNGGITILSDALETGDSAIQVVSTAGFQNVGTIRIGNEVVSYGAKTATTFGNLNRPQAQRHDSGSVVARNEDDFSFAATTNQREAVAQVASGEGRIEADYTWAPLWCKDYGGRVIIEADLYGTDDAGNEFKFPIAFAASGNPKENTALRLPLDRNANGIGDVYERSQRQAWADQYHAGVTSGLPPDMFANEGGDFEKGDPDNVSDTLGSNRQTSHAAGGDGLSLFEEYRGYILDGGSGHLGGHLRLSFARKEMLLEVDTSASLGAGGGTTWGVPWLRARVEDAAALFCSTAMPTVTDPPMAEPADSEGTLGPPLYTDEQVGCAIRVHYVLDDGSLPDALPLDYNWVKHEALQVCLSPALRTSFRHVRICRTGANLTHIPRISRETCGPFWMPREQSPSALIGRRLLARQGVSALAPGVPSVGVGRPGQNGGPASTALRAWGG